MEFFEKAHSLKTKEDLKKETLIKEKIKEQLKRMLLAYKKSDNELIRKSENTIKDIDDKYVSNYSYLNVTNNASDNESTKATLDSSDLDSVSNLTDDEGVPYSSKASHIEYLSNVDDSETSESDEISDQQDEHKTTETIGESSLFSGNISIVSSSSESDNSSLFDPDGILASKIHENLKKGNNTHDSLKRKINDNKNVINNKSLLEEHSQSSSEREQLNKVKKSKNTHFQSDTSEVDLKKSTKEQNELSNNQNILYSPSPTFVSITAEDLNTEKFDDILGHYRYATVKNITEKTNLTFSAFHNRDDLIKENSKLNSPTVEVSIEKNVSDVHLTNPDSSLQEQDDRLNLNADQSETNSENDTSIECIESLIERHQVFKGSNCFIVVLKHPVNLFIHGKVIVKKLGGTAQLYGYNLQDTPCEVYAPYYNFAHCLRTMEGNHDYYGLFNKLTTRGLSVAEAENIVTKLGSYDVVVALERLKNFKMDFVESNFNAANLFTKSTDKIESNLREASEILGCSFYSSQPYKHLEESTDWQQVVQFGLSEKSRGIICGGKGSGKSTFLRYYVNQLLSRGPILVIDLDPGQCEFTVAGSVSATVLNEPLLGPNYVHLRRPDIMLNIGIITTMDNPRRYVTAVDTLIARCSNDERLSSMPWIVNTMGMCNAIGLKFITYIIQRIQPTFLLQIELQAKKKNFEFHLTPQKVDELCNSYKNNNFFAKLTLQNRLAYSHIVLPAETYRVNTNMGNDNSVLAARDERYLNFLAYFGELADAHKTMVLLSIRPYMVRLQDLYIATNVKVYKESITKVLNGKVVALCQHSPQGDKTVKVFTLSDKPLPCYGHGLVRGIVNDIMYVITPTPLDELALVNTILYADWVPEMRGQEKNLPEGTVIPYRMRSQYQQRQLMFAPRRRFNPLQLLKMSRNA